MVSKGFWLLLGLSLLLAGCDTGSGGTKIKDGFNDGAQDQKAVDYDDPILWVNDSLATYQWYLYNAGDYALTQTTVATQAGEDIGAFPPGLVVSDQTLATNYAQGFSGRNLVINIVDTGLLLNHPDLKTNILIDGSYNFAYPFNGRSELDPSPTGDKDHGTSVAGLAAARGGNNLGVWGVAPAGLLKGFNLLQNQKLSHELEALGLANSNKPNLSNQNIAVFNMSYGSNPDRVELSSWDQQVMAQIKAGTENLRAGKGAVYVKAAGNEYYGGAAFSLGWCDAAIAHNITCYNANMEPANTSPYLMAIGAFNAQGKRASYSNTGSALWIVGPGGEFGYNQPAMLTTDLTGCDRGYANSTSDLAFERGEFERSGQTLNANCDYTATFNGTSSATPVVSGAAALLLEANPNLSWREVKHILATSARKIQSDLAENWLSLDDGNVKIEQGWLTNQAGYHFSNAFGFGALNLQDALQKAVDWKASSTQLAPLQTLEMAAQVYSEHNLIPDASAVGLTKTQTVSSDLLAESLLLEITIESLEPDKANGNKPIDISDYLIQVTSPSGTQSIMQTPFNAFRSGYDMNNMRLLSHAFYGEPIEGEWILQVWDVNNHIKPGTDPIEYDNAIKAPGEGQLTRWQLTIYGREAE